MPFEGKIKQTLVSMLLLAALAFPATVQFFHVLEGHEHPTCKEKAVHIHEDIPHCDLCAFHLASFDYTLYNYEQIGEFIVPSQSEKHITPILVSLFKHTNSQLRAPPFYPV